MNSASRRVAGVDPPELTHHAHCQCGYDKDLPKKVSTCPMEPLLPSKKHDPFSCGKIDRANSS